ncbi:MULTISPECIES: FAD-dependent monooxygenase [Mumia]|uniref:FAD-dependent monooxygenase n=1 Tax=Mumia TaxID=1546255 RepID=UPI00141EFF30|nr:MULTISPECIES: FAD-dependent monooxygenase [unclassified Mumia]QMW65438.1 FAD-dependent monooxygenase [Mumia sp. ZJ1417]
MDDSEETAMTDVLVVGAGPTGLTMALELAAQGLAVRVVDAAPDAVHESRALVVQARTLEVLDRLGVADDLVAAGDRASGVTIHGRGRTAAIRLFDPAITETAYPFLLFLSQARTERILLDHLAGAGVDVERGSTLAGLEQGSDAVTAVVDRAGRQRTTIRARYAVGCDGAHSAVRTVVGADFAGSTYPQTFVLADVEADGIDHGQAHAYLGEEGLLFFFPLGSPASWRALTMRPPGDDATAFADLERLVGTRTNGEVVVRDPVWLTDFSISERCVDHLRTGRVLLAGDAAHIHSPAGGQGMNTGIQDAVNLGWKLALVCRGLAGSDLLDSYEAERLPVARDVLEATGRVFRVATSSNRTLGRVRTLVGTTVLPLLARVPALRRTAFRAVAELDVRYRVGAIAADGQRTHRALRPGDRVPDGPVVVDGIATTLHRSLSPTAFTLVLVGPYGHTRAADVDVLVRRWGDLLRVVRVTVVPGVGEASALLVRPDGYVGATDREDNLAAVDRYLADVVGLTPAGLT